MGVDPRKGKGTFLNSTVALFPWSSTKVWTVGTSPLSKFRRWLGFIHSLLFVIENLNETKESIADEENKVILL